MRIEYLRRPQALKCAPTDTLMTIAQTMHEHQVSGLVVLDDERLVGIISHRDMVRAIAEGADPHDTQVRQYSMAVRHTAAAMEDTSQVAQRMLKNGQDHIPVLQAGAVVNVVPLRHVVAVDPGVCAQAGQLDTRRWRGISSRARSRSACTGVSTLGHTSGRALPPAQAGQPAHAAREQWRASSRRQRRLVARASLISIGAPTAPRPPAIAQSVLSYAAGQGWTQARRSARTRAGLMSRCFDRGA
jgi:CBS domain-containing protein